MTARDRKKFAPDCDYCNRKKHASAAAVFPPCAGSECLPLQAMQFRFKPALARLAHSGQRYIQQLGGFVRRDGLRCTIQPSHQDGTALKLRSDVPLRLQSLTHVGRPAGRGVGLLTRAAGAGA